jgi:uncharacterized Zn-finger protein
VLSSKSALQVHIKTVHEEVKPFKCSKCEASFGHKHLLQRHSRQCKSQDVAVVITGIAVSSDDDGKEPYQNPIII